MGPYSSAKARWDWVHDEFMAKSIYAQNDLESTFHEMRCAKGGDIRAFLTSLRYKREELAAASVSITPKDYQRTVLKGIPEELACFASGILSSARLFSKTAVNTETLIDHICEEADQLKSCCAKLQSKDHGAKLLAARDDALAATGSEGTKKKRCKGNCWNCGRPGHWAQACWSPKKEEKPAEDNAKADKADKAQKSESKPVGSANAVTTPDEAEDECWAVDFSFGVSDVDDIIDESDWLREEEEMAVAVIMPVSGDGRQRVELYDSGATRHISPYKSDFLTYTTLDPPVYLNAANQQRFPAIGTGTLSIRAPNGAVSSTLTLHNVLHAPAVGYMLVSLGALDKQGYHTSIGGGTLELYTLGGDRIARVPQSGCDLYHMEHHLHSANTVEMVSIMELHRRMGHIAALAPSWRRAWSLGSGWTPTHERLIVRHVCSLAPPINQSRKSVLALNRNVLAMRCTVTCGVHHPLLPSVGAGTLSPSLMMPLTTRSLTSCVIRQRLSVHIRLSKPGRWHSSFALQSRFSALIAVGNTLVVPLTST